MATENSIRQPSSRAYKFFGIIVQKNRFTIPHSTIVSHFSEFSDDPRQRWDNHNNQLVAKQLVEINGRSAGSGGDASSSSSSSSSILTHCENSNIKATTIEGTSNSTGDTSIGGGGGGGSTSGSSSTRNLKIELTTAAKIDQLQQQQANADSSANSGTINNNSGGGQTPSTPTVGKTLLNTNANLLPITTATDTFNNLKNLVKIDKSSSGGNINGNNNGNYRNNKTGNTLSGGNNNHKHNSPTQHNGLNGNSSSVNNSAHFSSGYNKNPVKIRQHDTEVSPRPRRSFASDSSSSRYYNKNSDILVGQAGNSNNNSNNNYNNGNGEVSNNSNNTGRRIGNGNSFNNHYTTDGNTGFNRNINSAHAGPRADDALNGSNNLVGNLNNDRNLGAGGSGGSATGAGGYNHHHHHQHRSQQRYIVGNSASTNDNGNGQQQQRPYHNNNNNNNGNNITPTGGAGYNNYNQNSKPYRERGERSELNTRSTGDYYREDYGNYRNNSEYSDAPRPSRYNNNNNYNNNYNNYNSLERGNTAPRYSGTRGNAGGYTDERPERDYRAYQNRTPPIRGPPHANSNSINGNNYNNNNNSASSSSSSSTNTVRGASPVTASRQQQHSIATPAKPSSPPPTTGRWVPPSLRPQHGLSQTEKNDAIFRKVRGILNKLTPEKFQELSDELLKLDLNSISVLNGVILLIFDKALDEPKYSSMYAQLCKRLSKEAPSFEKDSNNLCTFLRLLIAVCRDKFNNRLKRDDPIKDKDDKDKAIINNIIQQQQAERNNSGETAADPDEEEKRHLVKQRMLGNVKFIGELNKLDMLSNNVLHQCIMELLDKKKRRSASQQEMCEDMECLAQLLKTCGKNLDSEQGKELMNQYFEELERRSKSIDYPPRIRFMLKDVIELRENTWVPRKVGTTEGPVPIKQIRTDDDNMMIMRTPFAQRSRDMMRNNLDRDGDNWNPYHLNLQSSGYNTLSSLGLSSSSSMSMPYNNNGRSYNNRDRNMQNNYNNNNNNNRYNKHNHSAGPGGMMGMQRNDDMRMRGGNAEHMSYTNSSGGIAGNGTMLMNSKELAPRFKRNLITTNENTVDNLQMRPAANSLLFKAASQNHKFPTNLPISTPPMTNNNSKTNSYNTNEQSSLSNSQYPMLNTPTNPLGQAQAANMQEKQTSVEDKKKQQERISSNGEIQDDKKQAQQQQAVKLEAVEKEKNATVSGGKQEQKKKDKNINKEELLQKAKVYLQEHFFYEQKSAEENEEEQNTTAESTIETTEKSTVESESFDYTLDKQLKQFIDGFLELKLPEKLLKDVCINAVMDSLDKAAVNEVFLERIVQMLLALRQQTNLKPNIIVEIFKQVVNRMNDREALVPRIASHVAHILALAVQAQPPLLKLNEIAAYTDNGQHYPLFLLVLQQLHKIIGKEQLEEKFRASKIELMNTLPEADRNKQRFSEILDDRNLGFLYPLLKLETEMMRQLKSEPDATAFYKWIKTTVDAKYYRDPGFINALVTVVLKYTIQETTLSTGTDIKKLPEKTIIEREQNMAKKYCQILRIFISEHPDLQLVSLYGLQVVCYNENFPKGMLCRWFKYMYDEEVVEEDTFFAWKEEINDKYPGKGTALFQVNSWLTWLQEAESEDDE